jgi:dTDP-glucose 4,6-dehydratase
MERILVTGGLGFIGAHFIKLLNNKHKGCIIVNLDSKTYAASQHAEKDLASLDRYFYEPIDITRRHRVRDAIEKYEPTHIVHLAAESHVCRSIEGPDKFIETNITGTFNLLDEARRYWERHGGLKSHRFLYISTDEVFGELQTNSKEKFHEKYPLQPRSPYAASKACGNMLVQSYFHTYGLHTIITACTNNFGPYQHEEKLIPKTVRALRLGAPIELYGSGTQVRDWIYVKDHARALYTALREAKAGSLYCVGGNKELTNREVTETVSHLLSKHRSVRPEWIYTDKRPTDDQRYAISNEKIERELGFKIDVNAFEKNMEDTVVWYLKNT